MKHIRFTVRKVFAPIMAAAALFFGCSGLSTNSGAEDAEGDGAYITLSVTDPAARATALPETPQAADFDSFALIGSHDGAEAKSLGSWTSYTDVQSAKINVEAGSWTFTLTAKKGQTVYSGSTAKTITSGANALSFTLSLNGLSESGEGSISISLAVDESVKAVTAVLLGEDGGALSGYTAQDLALSSGSATSDKNATFTQSDVPSGNYLVRFFLYADAEKTLEVTKIFAAAAVTDGIASVTSVTVEKKDLSNVYTLTLDANGGTLSSTTSAQIKYTINTDGITLPSSDSISRTGYTFKGWAATADATSAQYEGGEDPGLYTIYKQKDCTLYAVWEINTYSIAYSLNSGAWTAGFTAPATYTVEDEITLPAAEKLSRAAYTFGGWYEAADFSGEAVSKVVKGTTGNKTLYAKWNAITAGGITIEVSRLSDIALAKTEDEAAFTLTADSGYTGYAWTIDGVAAADFSGAVASGATITIQKTALPVGDVCNITVTAKKDGIQYTAWITVKK